MKRPMGLAICLLTPVYWTWEVISALAGVTLALDQN